MSPSETTLKSGLLEHPLEAFDYYRDAGAVRVVCEEKHMGSRAVVIVCRDEESARKRFGVVNEGVGICYTRIGRRFFDDQNLEHEFLARLQSVAEAAGLWNEFDPDWLLLDCELMPWSAKAQELLRRQYAAVGSASSAALAETLDALRRASARGVEVAALLDRYGERAAMAADYISAYRRYCWPVRGLTDLKLAPFHLLATEDAVHSDKDHVWHMETLARLCGADEELLLATSYRVVELDDPASVDAGVAWWEELTGLGGEGMVVKPYDFIVRSPRGLTQPAVKCRGREYLRIIYLPAPRILHPQPQGLGGDERR
jgi:protein phosphatase